MNWKRIAALVVSSVMVASLVGCKKEPAPIAPVPTTEDKPILQTTGPTQEQKPTSYTPVYATAFGDTIYLATVPMMTLEGKEPECDVREISLGGRAHCGQEHKSEKSITRVVITEDIYPQSTGEWFRDMGNLVTVQGLEKLHFDSLKDMRFMFAGCRQLSQLDADGWDVSGVEDMTGIFDLCDALQQKPVWYEEKEGGLGDLVQDEDTFDGGPIH